VQNVLVSSSFKTWLNRMKKARTDRKINLIREKSGAAEGSLM
jgi:hypothetical protein